MAPNHQEEVLEITPPSTVDICQPTSYVQLFYNAQADSLATMLVEGHSMNVSTGSDYSLSSSSTEAKDLSGSSESQQADNESFDIVSWQLSDLSTSSGSPPTVWLDPHWYHDKDESLDRTLLLGDYDDDDDDEMSSLVDIEEDTPCGRRLFRQCSPFHYKRGKPYYYHHHRTTRSYTESDARRNLQPHRLTGGIFSYSVLQE